MRRRSSARASSRAHSRWLFFYDLPLTLATIVLALMAIPRDIPAGHRFDRISAALCMPALGLSFFALDRVARAPTEPLGIVLLAIGVAALAALIRRQRNRERPLFPTDLFALPRFSIPALTSVVMYAAQGLALAALPFLLVGSLDMSLIKAGVLLSVMPLATLLTAPAVGILCDRLPRWPFSAIGCVFKAAGFVMAATVGPGQDRTLLTVAIVLMGVGFAFVQNHNAKSMMLGAPLNRMGAAGGIQSTVRVIGQMAGPALVGISFHTFRDGGTSVSLGIGVALCVAGATLGIIYAAIGRRNLADLA